MKRKQSGIALINLILSLLIIICIAILFIANRNNEEANNIYEERTAVYYNKAKDIYSKENVIENTVTLDNSIFNQSGNSQIKINPNEGKRYYYNQLTEVGKTLYETVAKNIDSFIDGYEAIEIPTDEANASLHFQAAWDALSLDRPDIFWVDTYKISLVTRTTSFINSVKYRYRLEPKNEGNYFLDTFKTSQEVKDAIDEVQAVVRSIVSRSTGSTFDKVKFVHDELVDNLQYNENNHINNSNLYGALVEKKCVCEGYAESFKYIMDNLDIPCVIVYGDGMDSNGNTESHAWNYVKMDNGYWYAIDVTWDDPIVIGNGRLPESSRYRYFLKGSNSFNATHIPDEDVSGTGQKFKYPELASSDYK